MPRTPAWYAALPDALEQLEAFPRDLLTRAELQVLLGVSKRRAVTLMHRFGAVPLGSGLVVARQVLIRQLEALRSRRVVQQEIQRHTRLIGQLRQARREGVRVPVAPPRDTPRLEGLPPEVTLAPGRIEVRFADPREALQRLYALAQVIAHDFDTFEAQVTTGTPGPDRDPTDG